jgi:hypothetical protein
MSVSIKIVQYIMLYVSMNVSYTIYEGTSLALLKGGNTLANNSDLTKLDDNWEAVKLDAVTGYAIKLPSSTISADKL